MRWTLAVLCHLWMEIISASGSTKRSTGRGERRRSAAHVLHESRPKEQGPAVGSARRLPPPGRARAGRAHATPTTRSPRQVTTRRRPRPSRVRGPSGQALRIGSRFSLSGGVAPGTARRPLLLRRSQLGFSPAHAPDASTPLLHDSPSQAVATTVAVSPSASPAPAAAAADRYASIHPSPHRPAGSSVAVASHARCTLPSLPDRTDRRRCRETHPTRPDRAPRTTTRPPRVGRVTDAALHCTSVLLLVSVDRMDGDGWFPRRFPQPNSEVVRVGQ
jgi:hypothetical protein